MHVLQQENDGGMAGRAMRSELINKYGQARVQTRRNHNACQRDRARDPVLARPEARDFLHDARQVLVDNCTKGDDQISREGRAQNARGRCSMHLPILVYDVLQSVDARRPAERRVELRKVGKDLAQQSDSIPSQV